MNKELTPLEALEIIKNAGTIYVGCASNIYTRYSFEIKIIEKELKEYELMKNAKILVADKKISDDDFEKLINQRIYVSNLEPCEIKPLFDEETEKKLKALEIIKEKRVDISWLLRSENSSKYNLGVGSSQRLKKTEYDLVKEIIQQK